MNTSKFLGRSGGTTLLVYLAIWAGSLAYLAVSGGDWVFPIASLVIFGLGLGSIIWFLTRKMGAAPVPVAGPRRQSLAFLAYITVYAVLLVGIWLGSIKQATAPGPGQELAVVGYKLLIHVALPAGLVFLLGGPLQPLFESGLRRRGFWPTLVVLVTLLFGLLAAVTPSLKDIAATGLTLVPAIGLVLLSWAWMSLEAGLCEEFLFRACLQSRLAAWFKSPASAIFVTSILFSLSHWPGLYLRGGPGTDGWSTDPLQVAAFTIATLSPLSVALGLLWARSRSLLLVVLVHGAIDALPNTTDMIHAWS